MAFENVDVGSLRSSLNSCKNAINYTAGKQFVNGNHAFWTGEAKTNLVKSMNNLYSEKFKALEDKLNYYIGITYIIEEYKNIQYRISVLRQEIAQLRAEINSLTPKLYYKEKIDKGYFDENNKWVQEWEYEDRIDDNIKKQIDSKEAAIEIKLRDIENKEKELQQLEAKVNSSI